MQLWHHTKPNRAANMAATTHDPNFTSTNTLGDVPVDHELIANGPPARIFLKPIAAPSALGLAAYASSTFIISTYLTAWYGNPGTQAMIWPFVLTFGGFGQFAAGMWAFNARDTLATVFHTMWGSFWIAFSLYLFLGANNTVPGTYRYDYNEAWAIWMVPLTVLTYICAAASFFRDLPLAVTFTTLGTASLFGILGWFLHSAACIKIMGYLGIVSSAFAAYRVACFLMAEAVHNHRDVLPRFRHPAHKYHTGRGYQHGFGEPGVISAY